MEGGDPAFLVGLAREDLADGALEDEREDERGEGYQDPGREGDQDDVEEALRREANQRRGGILRALAVSFILTLSVARTTTTQHLRSPRAGFDTTAWPASLL